ncbi:hypothetical protein KPL74_20810 [Bacillus sp. NP157]|nr:hypothetical protein KPL74_20810 [Bacillus sp. NP157]
MSGTYRILAGPLYGTEPWPLRFNTHQFEAVCFNTLACSIVYNHFEFGTQKQDRYGVITDSASGPPPSDDWKAMLGSSHGIPLKKGKTFPGPIEARWTSLDGTEHHATIDLDEIFRERIVLHRVKRDEVKEAWLVAKSTHPVSPLILLEINDRLVRVYMEAVVATEAEQKPGNPNSHIRHDVMLAWTQVF